MLKLVCKVFWSTTYMGIPPLLLQEAQFTGWMTCLLQAVQRPVPQVCFLSCAIVRNSDRCKLHWPCMVMEACLKVQLGCCSTCMLS